MFFHSAFWTVSKHNEEVTIQLRYTKLYERNLQINVIFVVYLSVVKHLLCSMILCSKFNAPAEVADPFIIASVDVLTWKLMEAITGFGVGLCSVGCKSSHHS